MATFTVIGYEISSDTDSQVSESKAAQLQFVAPLGQATLDFRYVSEGNQSAEVSLSDYNIILNGQHLNDGTLPDRIELFNASWPDWVASEGSSLVFNLAFSQDGTWSDYIFSVDNDALPNLTDPDRAHDILSNSNFSTLNQTEPDNFFTLQLDEIPGVAVSGVVQKMFDANMPLPDQADGFEFSPLSDAEAANLSEMNIAVITHDADHLAPQPQDAPYEDAAPDPVDVFDFGFDDLAG